MATRSSSSKVSSSVVLFLGLLVLTMQLVADAAVTCNTVYQGLFPCIGYVQNNGVGAVPARCCQGIRSLYATANSTPDRQTVCRCLKTAAANYPGANIGVAAAIPDKCGVHIPYKLSPSTDCATVRY